MNQIVQLENGDFLIGAPHIGALSVFDETEYLAFEYWQIYGNEGPSGVIDTRKFWENFGCKAEESRHRSDLFSLKLKQDGWMRSHPPLPSPDAEAPLRMIYLTVTRRCNLSCPYCYQGLKNRNNTDMTVDVARRILNRIGKLFPRYNVTVSGGEPFSNPRLFDILDLLSERGLPFVILSNGTLLNREIAERLSGFPSLAYVQVSIDGINEQTHGLTRGNSFHAAFSGVRHLIEQGVSFALAPTIHNGNVDEGLEVARFALSNNGFFTPNNLRELPMASGGGLKLTPKTLEVALKHYEERLIAEFGKGKTGRLCAPNFGYGDPCQKVERRKFRCGLGETIMDIDWNGDVYPCNLLKGRRFIMGNLLEQTLDEIRSAPHIRRYRTLSTEIPKCRNCLMVGICGGGCRAAADSAFGSFHREDNLCPQLFQSEVARLTLAKEET